MYTHSRVRLVVFVLGAAIVMLFTWPSSAIASGNGGRAAADSAVRTETGISSSQADAYNLLQRSVNRLYAAAVDQNTDLMSRSLAIVDYRFKQLPVADEVSIEGLQEMSALIRQLRLSLALPNPDKTNLPIEAAALLLAADALAKPDQPLWHNYRPVLAEDMDVLVRAVHEDPEVSGVITPEAALGRLRSNYETIRTAAMLSLADDLSIKRSDAVLRYAATVLTAVPYNRELGERLVPPLQDAILGLFPIPDEHDESALVPPAPGASWAWSALMGSFIVTILTWAGWLRYRGDEYSGTLPRMKAGEREDAAERLMDHWRNRK